MTAAKLRQARLEDAGPVLALVHHTGVLDPNSCYAYAATFRHFGATCVVAEHGGEVVGFVTAYRLPERPGVLFVWQVGVHASQRGQGLATRMLRWILDAPAAEGVRWIETTVTPSNAPSRKLFAALARRLETGCEVGPGISAEVLGEGHEPEELFRIGPLRASTP